jgi:hypothetical protein
MLKSVSLNALGFMSFENFWISSLLLRWRALSFVMAIMIYGFLGSPTPDSLGFIEIIIALLLICAFGLRDMMQPFLKPLQQEKLYSGVILAVFGLSVPVMIAGMAGHPLSLVLRDIAAFLFLLFPILGAAFLQKQYLSVKNMLACFMALGGILALRALAEGLALENLLFLKSDFFMYLSNSPAILFAAIWGSGLCFLTLVRLSSFRDCIQVILLLGIVVACLSAMIITFQRASIGLWVLSVAIIFVINTIRQPYRVWPLIFICTVGLFLCWGMLSGLMMPLIEKTQNVGANMRFEEIGAVWLVITQNPFAFLFGAGWGASFDSPAVGNMSVNYTHGLLSSCLLKTGLIGTVLVLFYILNLIYPLFHIFKETPALVLALFCPLIIDIFLYASFKSLDFGLLLLMIKSLPLAVMKKE